MNSDKREDYYVGLDMVRDHWVVLLRIHSIIC